MDSEADRGKPPGTLERGRAMGRDPAHIRSRPYPAFICAMQVEAFSKVRGKAYATTMCTGNLRSGTELLSLGQFEHDGSKKRAGLHFYWIDLVFIAGAAAGALVCGRIGEKSIWLCNVTLLLSLAFIHREKRGREV